MNELQTSRTYVDHLRAEHRQLHAEIRRIKNAFFDDVGHHRQPGELLRELSALNDELRRHFAEEEEGGCLEEAVSHCPGVAHEADDLQREHPALLKGLEHIIAALKTNNSGDAPPEVRQEFDDFTKLLLAHEAAENKVMQRAFGVTVNGDGEE